MTLKDRAYRNADMKLFVILFLYEHNDKFSDKFPLFNMIKLELIIKKKIFAQKKHNAKNYKVLFELMENCELIFSARVLANDREFNLYCLQNNSKFVTQYLENAIHEMQFKPENLYDGYIDYKQEVKEITARNKYVATSFSMFAGLSVVAAGLYSYLRSDGGVMSNLFSSK